MPCTINSSPARASRANRQAMMGGRREVERREGISDARSINRAEIYEKRLGRLRAGPEIMSRERNGRGQTRSRAETSPRVSRSVGSVGKL
jgi:hypothetical protein